MAFVLIVDDEPSIRKTIQLCLEIAGHRVLTAEGAAEGRHMLRDNSFDVIVTDIIMPGDSGIELLKAIRSESPSSRIIMMTGDPAVEPAAEAVRNGASDYLIKPVSGDAICRAVETAARMKAMDDRCRQLEQENLTYQKNLEELVSSRTEELQASNDQLSEALEKLRASYAIIHNQERLHTLGQLASGIAHDFNNALMPILGLTDHLLQQVKSDDGSPEQTELLDIVLSAATDAQAIVRRLQEFYSPAEHFLTTPVPLGPLVDKVVQMMTPAWMGEGKSIRINNEIGNIPEVAANESQLRQLLIHLLLNSAHAIAENGTITIGAFAEKNMVTLSVRDNGCGMSDETAAGCMEPFFTTKRKTGTGLGLAMCANIARQYGGSISLESKEGQGTCVTVSLPVAGTRLTTETTPSPAQHSNLRILVIDDDERSLMVLRKHLAAEGHEAETFNDPQTGLARLESASFDMVMTDRAMMPISGDVVATRAKRMNPEMPVIMVTGFGDMINARGLWIPGVDLVVSKPVTRESLKNAISTVLHAALPGYRAKMSG